MKTDRFRQGLFALTLAAAVLQSGHGLAQQAGTPTAGSATAADMADFFSQVGNKIYEDCIFELSQEQIEVQQALIQAYIKHGATSIAARRLAVKQIQPPQLSDKCEQIKNQSKPSAPSWTTITTTPVEKKPPVKKAAPKIQPEPIIPSVVLANPPYSFGAERGADGKTGARHVRAAFLRLARGGRLVAIMPEWFDVRRFLKGLPGPHALRLSVAIPSAFIRHGTSITTRLLERRRYGSLDKDVAAYKTICQIAKSDESSVVD